MCDTFKNNKIVNIPENANYLEYMNNLMECINENGYFEYYDTLTNKKEHRIKGNIILQRNNDDRNNFEPCLVIHNKHVQPYSSNFDRGVNKCDLCKNLNIAGFKNYEGNQFENISPNMKKLFLLYKDMIIYDNSSPYMEGHLMLLSLNHVDKKIIGSQYEILNINTLTKVMELYSKCASGISMGFNYALTGSQTHFHIHIFLKKFIPNIPYDDMIDFYANTLDAKIVNDISNYEIITDNVGIYHILEFTMNNENFGKVIIAKYTCPTYGYSGILVTTKNLPQNLRKYCATLNKILNEIENSGSHTFSLYFGRSDNNLNVCILPQFIEIKYDNNEEQRIYQKPVESFRNISAFADHLKRENIQSSFLELKKRIKKYVKIDVLTIVELNKLINTNVYNEISPLGDNQLNMHFNMSNKSTYNKYTISLFKNKKSVDNPYVVFFHGTAGIGKSTAKNDINELLTNMNLDPTNFIYLTIDELFETIPGAIKCLNTIKDILKLFLDKKIGEITPLVSEGIKDKKLKEIKNGELFDLMSKEDFIEIYRAILDKKYPQTNKKTLYNYYVEDIKTKYNTYTIKLRDAILEYIKDNKLNVIIEVITLNNDVIQLYKDKLGIRFENTIYINKKFYLENNDTINISDKEYKFLYRNILFRNIDCGRLFDINSINRILNNFYMTHNQIMANEHSIINRFASKYITLYSGYELNKKELDKIKDFVENINYISFPHFSGDIVNNSEIKIKIKNLKCFDKKNGDDHIIYDNFYDSYTKNSYGLSCFSVPGVLNYDEKFDIYDEIKAKLTDFNTDYLFNDNITSIIIYLFIYSTENAIKTYIRNFQKKLENRNSIPDEIKKIKLKPYDIKLILKGGLSIRSLCNQFITHIKQTIEDNIKIDTVDNENLNEALNIIKSTFDNSINTPFTGIFKKSDIDFLIYLNRGDMTKEQYDFIINDLQKITIYILLSIKKLLIDTHFFDREQYVEDKMKEIFKNKLKHPESKLDLTHIKYNNTIHKTPGKNDITLPESVKQSFYIEPKYKLSGDLNQQESLLLTPTNMFVFDPVFNRKFSHENTNMLSPYYITVNNNIKIIKGLVETFSLVRLKNCYVCGFENDANISKYSGELIDVGFMSYNSLEHEHIKTHPNYILRLRQSHDLFDYNLNVFSLEFQLREIEKMLIDTTVYIWENAKYAKRIKRYFFIDLLEKFTSIENIIDYITFHYEYKDILNFLHGNLTTDGIEHINGEDYIQFKDSTGKIVGKTNNKFVVYLFGDKIKEAHDFIENPSFDITQFINNKRTKFNINVDLSTPDKIESFKEHFKSNENIYKNDLINIIIDIIKLSESIFSIYLFYPNKFKEIKQLRIDEKIIKQWGGYKKLYLDMKEKYYKLKYNN